MLDLADLHFHDSSVTSFAAADTALRMVIEDVNDPVSPFEKQYNLILTFKDITSIKIDGIQVHELKGCELEGSILGFEAANQHVRFLIQWTDYKTRSDHNVDYEFHYASLEIHQF